MTTETDLDETLDAAAHGVETDEADDNDEITSEIDVIGHAAGLVAKDDKPFRGIEEVERRDQHRWELDPRSEREVEEDVAATD